jgi:hypothetical protein
VFQASKSIHKRCRRFDRGAARLRQRRHTESIEFHHVLHELILRIRSDRTSVANEIFVGKKLFRSKSPVVLTDNLTDSIGQLWIGDEGLFVQKVVLNQSFGAQERQTTQFQSWQIIPWITAEKRVVYCGSGTSVFCYDRCT